MPALWMLNPEVFAVTANLMMAPTTTSTMPNAIRPMPELLFMALQCRLHRQLVQGPLTRGAFVGRRVLSLRGPGYPSCFGITEIVPLGSEIAR